MRDLVLGPLDMKHSTYEQPLPESWAQFAATAHPWRYQPVKGKWHVYPEMAAAGLWTTASDLARVGIEVQLALKGDSEFLSESIAPQMLTPQTDDNNGMGFFLQGEGKTIRFGHGGWDEGFVAQLTMYKELGIGSVIMVNSNQGAPMMPEIERAIAREYDWPGYFPEEKAAVQISQDTLQAYVGEYVTESGFQFIVTQEGTSLIIEPSGQPPIELHPKTETEFFMKVVNADVTFEKTDDGKITGLKLHQAGRQIAALKK
jgi:CubicO group peptidase (beta-lactamase class C family)